MNRLRDLLTLIGVISAIPMTLTGCSSGTHLDLSSPQSTYNSLVAASSSDDYGLFWDAIGDNKRCFVVSATAYQAIIVHSIVDTMDRPDKSALEMDREFEHVLSKHGLSYDQLKSNNGEGAGADGGKVLLDAVSDKKAFFEDMLVTSKTKVSSLIRFPAGDLRDIEVAGDHAFATLPDGSSDIGFEKVDGKWFHDGSALRPSKIEEWANSKVKSK